MEQLEATEKKSSPQHPLMKDGKSKSFRQKNGLKIAKLDIESAKQKMFDMSIQSPLALSSHKSLRSMQLPGLSEDSDASLDAGHSSSPKYTPKLSSKPNQLFNHESSPLLRSVQKKSSWGQSIFSNQNQQQFRDHSSDASDEPRRTTPHKKSLMYEIRISSTEEVVKNLSNSYVDAEDSGNEGKHKSDMNEQPKLENEPLHLQILPGASENGTSGVEDSSGLENSQSPVSNRVSVLSIPTGKLSIEKGNSPNASCHIYEQLESRLSQPTKPESTNNVLDQVESSPNQQTQEENNHQNQMDSEATATVTGESSETTLEQIPSRSSERLRNSFLVSKSRSIDQPKRTSFRISPVYDNNPTIEPETNQHTTNTQDSNDNIDTEEQPVQDIAENPINRVSLRLTLPKLRANENINLKLKEENSNNNDDSQDSNSASENAAQEEVKNVRVDRKNRKRTGFFLNPRALLKANLIKKHKQVSSDENPQEDEEQGNLTERAVKQNRVTQLINADSDDYEEIVDQPALNESIEQLERGFYSDSQVKYSYWESTIQKE